MREKLPWCVPYTDDVVILAKSKNALQTRLERWRETLESRGLKISRSKTEYMTDLDGEQDATKQIGGRDLKRVIRFKYLGSVTQASGKVEKEINHRIQSGWNNWRKITGVVCDKRVPIRLKGGIHKAVVRPARMYGNCTYKEGGGKKVGCGRNENVAMDVRCDNKGYSEERVH